MHPRQIKAAFTRGENVTQLLRREQDIDFNSEEIIETAYDLQAGTYIAALDDQQYLKYKTEYGRAVAAEIGSLVNSGGSILEPGIGEGTTLSFVMKECRDRFQQFHGFDISWSRIAKCRQWLASQNERDVFLSVASIFNAPYAENSFDIVYTSHTLEPNAGFEAKILAELYRITSKYLILLEPGFEFANPQAQARMNQLGYVKGLKAAALGLGMKVLKHELFSVSANPLNPTAILVIEKSTTAADSLPQLACPRFGDPIFEYADSCFAPGSLRAYPKIQGIPCLRKDDGIIASNYQV